MYVLLYKKDILEVVSAENIARPGNVHAIRLKSNKQ